MPNTIAVKDAAGATQTVHTLDNVDARLGATTDLPSTAVEDATAATGISLWKGMKNYLRTLVTSLLPASLGQKTKAASLAVTLASDQDAIALAAGEAHVGEVGGKKVEVSTEITRPSDVNAYAAGDSVNTSTSSPTVITFANFARVSGGTGYITKIRIATDKKSITPRLRLHLFNASPTLVNDNAAFARYYADESKRIGYVDLPAMFTSSDTTNSTLSETQDATIRIPFVAVASRSIFGVLELLDAFTPASGQKFNVTLAGELD